MALEEVGRPQVATTLTAVTRLNTTTEDGRVEAPPRCTLTGTEGSNPSLSADKIFWIVVTRLVHRLRSTSILGPTLVADPILLASP